MLLMPRGGGEGRMTTGLTTRRDESTENLTAEGKKDNKKKGRKKQEMGSQDAREREKSLIVGQTKIVGRFNTRRFKSDQK